MARARKSVDRQAASPKGAEKRLEEALERLERQARDVCAREAELARRLEELQAQLHVERAEWERRIGALEAENAALRRRERVAREEVDRLIADLEGRLAGAPLEDSGAG